MIWFLYTFHTKVCRMEIPAENKQTWSLPWGNPQFRLHLTTEPVEAVSPLPLTRTPTPPPRLTAGTKPPLCRPASGSQPGRTLSRFNTTKAIRASWGWWGCVQWMGVVGLTDGVGVGTVPRPACPLLLRSSARSICNADRLPLAGCVWEKRINSWDKARLRWWQMSFPFWFLTFYSP